MLSWTFSFIELYFIYIIAKDQWYSKLHWDNKCAAMKSKSIRNIPDCKFGVYRFLSSYNYIMVATHKLYMCGEKCL